MRRWSQSHDLWAKCNEAVVFVVRLVMKRDVDRHPDLEFSIADCRFELLLLFLLLHEMFFAAGIKCLEDVGVKKSLPDVVQLDLNLINIVMQSSLENFLNGAELQLRREATTELFRVV